MQTRTNPSRGMRTLYFVQCLSAAVVLLTALSLTSGHAIAGKSGEVPTSNKGIFEGGSSKKHVREATWSHLMCPKDENLTAVLLQCVGLEYPSPGGSGNVIEIDDDAVVSFSVVAQVLRYWALCQHSSIDRPAAVFNDTIQECGVQDINEKEDVEPLLHLADQSEEKAIELFKRIDYVYHPHEECDSSSDIVTIAQSYLPSSSGLSFDEIIRSIASVILKGDCLTTRHISPTDEFIDYLFTKYGDNVNALDQNSLEKLLQDLHIGKSHPHDHHHHDHNEHDAEHDHDHDHDKHDDHDHHHDNDKHDDHDHDMHDDHDHDSADKHEDHDHNHVDANHPATTRRKRNIPRLSENLVQKNESKNQTSDLIKRCWSTDDFLQEFALHSNNSVTPREFIHLCPVIIHQIVTGVCQNSSPPSEETERPKSWEAYVYGSISVFIISLCAVAGVLLQPFLHTHAYKYIMMGFIGLAFGSLSADALLHLLPEALGLHSHDHESDGHHDMHDHSHHHSHGHSIGQFSFENVPRYLWLQLGTLAAIYGLFMFESFMEILTGKDHDDEDGHHGHTHIPEINGNLRKDNKITDSSVQLTSVSINGSVMTFDDKAMGKSQDVLLKSQPLFLGLSSLALMVTIGDAVHNFGDGVALGVAFSDNLIGGLSTSLAVFCHELPHEFGDFVVLLSTGLSIKQAAMLNFLSALSAFAGLYIGIPLGENKLARQWILAVCAGVFLYVALTDMLPEMKQMKGSKPWRMFLVKNIGAICGILILLVIALFEEYITLS